MAKRIPSYRLHKASGQAVVVIRGDSHYLGQFDTPESRELYERLICEYKAKLHQESVSGRYPWTCYQLIVWPIWSTQSGITEKTANRLVKSTA